MRRTISIAFTVFLLIALSNPVMSDVGVGVGAHYYHITDTLYKDVYSGGSIMINSFLSFELIKKLELRAEANYFKKKGKTPYKGEPVTLILTPLVAGMRFRIVDTDPVSPYLGAGITYLLYNEDVPESFGEDVSESTIGFLGEAGVYFHLGKKFLLDINLRYVKADAEPFGEKRELGGFRAGLSVEYRF